MDPSQASGDFARAYIGAWSTEDPAERRRLIEEVYAEDAEFFADEPGDDPVVRHGRDDIMINITEVNERLTQGHGLSTQQTGVVENHDLTRISWQMTTPTGDVAMTGMNLLTRDATGMITRDYIFIG